MARYAIIKGGVAVNITEAEADYAQVKGWVLAPTAHIGDAWDGATWHTPEPPAAPVPDAITRAQGKAALIEVGMWDDVTGFVAGIEDPTERALADVALNDTLEWRRSSPFLNTAADALGLPPEMLDALFVRAAEIHL